MEAHGSLDKISDPGDPGCFTVEISTEPTVAPLFVSNDYANAAQTYVIWRVQNSLHLIGISCLAWLCAHLVSIL